MGRRRELQLRKRRAIQTVAAMFGMIGLVLYLMKETTSLQVISATSPVRRSCREPIDWRVQKIEDLTLEQIIEYVEWTNSTSCRLTHHIGGHVHPQGVDGQKAVCMDPLIRPEANTECLVYSFGISNEWTFDEAAELMGCRIYAFDPSMNEKIHDHSPKIHFYPYGLGDRDERWNKDPNMNWTMKSLESVYYNLLKHEDRVIDYLKIDIESSEWIVLPQILSSGMMDRVRQLGLEVHLPEQGGLEEFRQCVRILKSLEDYGLVRFDSKYNPWSINWNPDVDYEGFFAYEIAWLNPRLFRTGAIATTSIRPHLKITKRKKIHNSANIKKSKYRNLT